MRKSLIIPTLTLVCLLSAILFGPVVFAQPDKVPTQESIGELIKREKELYHELESLQQKVHAQAELLRSFN